MDRCVELERLVESLEGVKNSLQRELKEAKDTIDSVGAKYRSAQSLADERGKSIATLVDKNEELIKRLEPWQSAAEMWLKNYEEKRSELNARDATISSLRSQIGELNKLTEDRLTEIKRLSARCTSLGDAARSYEGELEELKRKTNELATECFHYQNRLPRDCVKRLNDYLVSAEKHQSGPVVPDPDLEGFKLLGLKPTYNELLKFYFQARELLLEVGMALEFGSPTPPSVAQSIKAELDRTPKSLHRRIQGFIQKAPREECKSCPSQAEHERAMAKGLGCRGAVGPTGPVGPVGEEFNTACPTGATGPVEPLVIKVSGPAVLHGELKERIDLPIQSEEEADAELRYLGVDPEKLAERGVQFVREVKDELKNLDKGASVLVNKQLLDQPIEQSRKSREWELKAKNLHTENHQLNERLNRAQARTLYEIEQPAQESVRAQIADYLEHCSKVEVLSILGPQSREIIGWCASWVRNKLDEKWREEMRNNQPKGGSEDA